MNAQVRTNAPPQAAAITSIASGVLQRNCACGQHTIAGGECESCRKEKSSGHLQRGATSGEGVSEVPQSVNEGSRSANQLADARKLVSMEQHFNHDFSHVPAKAERSISQASDFGAGSLSKGIPINALKGLADVFIDGAEGLTTKFQGVSISDPLPPPPAKPPVDCPTAIKIAAVKAVDMEPSDLLHGYRTGFGGYAQMEVSDGDGKNWDNTKIHENLKSITNTCGNIRGCSNVSATGGKGGSTFTVGSVGRGLDFLGIANLPAERNRFYDTHVIGLDFSVLHKLGKPACQVQCQQSYDCGGKQFGPNFMVTYSMKPFSSPYADLTQIELKVEAGQ